MIQPAKRLDAIKEYYFSGKLKEIAEMNANGLKVINLGIGSPDLPPAPATIEELGALAARPDAHAYQGYVGVPALRQAFADWYQKYFQVALDPKKEILPLLGSKEGIMHVCMTYLQKGDAALIPNPGYPAYRAAVLLSGAKAVDYPLEEKNGWLPDLDALSKKNLSKVKIMWVNYPNMPTGAKATDAFFKELVDFARQHSILLVNDNPYSFILNQDYKSILQTPGAKDVALELNSLSKSHNMAGWRVGTLVGKASYLDDVLRFKSNMDSGMFLPVQMAAVKALQHDESWYENLNAAYTKRREKIFRLMQVLNCSFDENQTGMFVWAKTPEGDGYALTDKILYENRVFITPGGIFGVRGDAYIRASLCATEETIEAAIQRIESGRL